MWRGCFVLLVFGLATAFVEWRLIEQRQLPNPVLLTLVLTIGATMVAGNVWGLWDALRARAGGSEDWHSWQDGRQVRIGGIIRAGGVSLRSPFGHRDAVAYQFRMFQSVRHGTEADLRYPAMLRGFACVPCALETPQGPIALRGFPWLKNFPEEEYEGEPGTSRAAMLLASATWRAADRITPDVEQYEDLLSGAGDSEAVCVINQRAREILFTPDGELRAGQMEGGPAPQIQGEQAAAAIHQRLQRGAWTYREYVLAPGMQVTVEGTYRQSPSRIEVQRSARYPLHAIHPGTPSGLASKELVTAGVFLLALGTLTIAAHYAVYGNAGELYLRLLEWLKNAA